MGWLTRFLASKMEDPAKRQADFEAHMGPRRRSARKCALSREITRAPRLGLDFSRAPCSVADRAPSLADPPLTAFAHPSVPRRKKNWNQPTKSHKYWGKDKMQSTVRPPPDPIAPRDGTSFPAANVPNGEVPDAPPRPRPTHPPPTLRSPSPQYKFSLEPGS